jgi:hypothetical protein
MMFRQQLARTYQPIAISLQQKKGAIKELKERDEIVIKPADKCSAVGVSSSLILLGMGQKLSPLESIRISSAFRSFDDKLTIVSFWSLLISSCLENLCFRLVSPEVTDDSK